MRKKRQFSSQEEATTELRCELEKYAHNKDCYHGVNNGLMTWCHSGFLQPYSRVPLHWTNECNCIAFCYIEWGLAEGIIWAYWIHRSLLLAGGFKVSLIFWFWRSVNYFSHSFSVIAALFPDWKVTLLEILNNILCAAFERYHRQEQQTFFLKKKREECN